MKVSGRKKYALISIFLILTMVFGDCSIAFAGQYYGKRDADNAVNAVMADSDKCIDVKADDVYRSAGRSAGITKAADAAGDFSFTFNAEKNGYILSKYKGKEANPVIPDSFNDGENGVKPVVAIGDKAFDSNRFVKKIVVQNSVREIGESAFSSCSGLERVELAEGVEKIGKEAFRSCSKIENIKIPASAVYLGADIFKYCSKLAGIEIAEGNAKYSCIGNVIYEKSDSAGRKVLSIHSCPIKVTGTLEIPDGVEKLADGVFKYQTMECVQIPASVNEIGKTAFSVCSKLKNIEIAAENAKYSCIGNVIYEKSDSAGRKVLSIHSCPVKVTGRLEIPDGVEIIEDNVFKSQDITYASIPATVKSLGKTAFAYCSKLTGVEIAAGNEKYFAEENIIYERTVNPGEAGGNSSKAALSIHSCPVKLEGKVTVHNGVETLEDNVFKSQNMTSVYIPATVTSIGKTAFAYCSRLAGVEIASENANYFAEGNIIYETADRVSGGEGSGKVVRTYLCPVKLSGELVLSDRVEEITDNIFKGMGITGVVIPASVKSISRSAFAYCRNLGKIEVAEGNGVYFTEKGVLYEKKDGKINVFMRFGKVEGELVIPDGVEVIPDNVFNGMGITSLKIPASVKSIGKNAFSGCNDLSSVEVAKENTNYFTDNGVLYERRDGKVGIFLRFAKTEGNLSIPEGTEVLGDNAFSGMNIKNVIIPASVKSISRNAFANCSMLEKITVDAGNAFYSDDKGVLYEGTAPEGSGNKGTGNEGSGTEGGSGSGAAAGRKLFLYPAKMTGIYNIPEDTSEMYDSAFKGSMITEVIIPGSIKVIGKNAFDGCEYLEKAVLAEGVETVSADAFKGCVSLADAVLAESIKKIDQGAFSGCSALKEIKMGASLEEIGKNAFEGCRGLREIAIPAKTVRIGEGFVSGCAGLESIIVDADNTGFLSCDGILFSKDKKNLIVCPRMKTGSYSVPDGTTKIYRSAFEGSGLSEVVLPESVTGIDNYTFRNAAKLQNVKFGTKVNKIGTSAFENCTGLKKVTIPAKVYGPGQDAFKGCRDLEEVVMVQGTGQIGTSCFEGCRNLKKIVMPASVTYISKNAFLECDRIDEIHYAGTEEQWKKVRGIENIPMTTVTMFYGSDGSKVPASREYIITLNAKGGNVPSVYVKTSGGKIELPVPERGNGFVFEGWFTEMSGGAEVTSETVFNRDTVIYAHWHRDEINQPVNPDEEVKLFDAESASYAGTGSVSDPYRILIWLLEGKVPTNTAPGKFWKPVADGNDLNVVFENRQGNVKSGNLMYSYSFEDGNISASHWNEDFTNAFRLSPYTEFRENNGNLEFAHAWKGDYSTYWSDWTYRINVCEITGNKDLGFSYSDRILPGDKVNVSHYGNYVAGETSRGSDYSIDFDSEKISQPSRGSIFARYEPWTRQMIVDKDGYLTFSGKDMIIYGGNYRVEPVSRHYPGEENADVEKHENPDGSVTETVKRKDGTVIETTTKKDGSVAAEVTVPEDKENVTVRIPKKEMKPGEVAVIVKADGTREVIKKSVAVRDGIVVQLDESAKIEIVDNSKSFNDVENGHWAEKAVDFVTSHEIFNGTGNGAFAPETGMTRGMLVKVLHNFENNPESAASGNFGDVAGDAWYADAVKWAAGNGIVSGTGDGEFAPNDEITREQLATILYRFAGKNEVKGELGKFSDASKVSGYAKDAMIWAVEAGLINGMGDNELNPQGSATRAQVAAIMMRFCEMIVK